VRAPKPASVAVLAAGFLLAGGAVGAIDWPSPESPLRVSFGQNVRGRPAVGLSFAAPAKSADAAARPAAADPAVAGTTDAVVRSADSGEIVFAQDAGRSVNGWPSPLGAWEAVRQSEGLILVYGHLAEADAGSATLVEKGALIGRAGATGWSVGIGFYFSVYDAPQGRWVNPAALAPPRPDQRQPTVRSVALVGRDGQSIDPATVKSIRQGAYRLLVESYDTEDGAAPALVAPYKMYCLVNGAEQCALSLETIAAPSGALEVSRTAPSPAAQAYASAPAYDLGEVRLARGRAGLEIIVRDAGGRERVVSYSLNVE
jgi:hypothetical protein